MVRCSKTARLNVEIFGGTTTMFSARCIFVEICGASSVIGIDNDTEKNLLIMA